MSLWVYTLSVIDFVDGANKTNRDSISRPCYIALYGYYNANL